MSPLNRSLTVAKTAVLVAVGVLAFSAAASAQHLGGGFGYGYYGGWHYPYYGYGYGGYGYGGFGYDPRGSLRIEVKPDQARVYVDGAYVGIVDEFDGAFQRLHLSPGRHEIAFKQEGFKTHRIMVYAPSGHTVKLRYEMIRGTGEDTRDDLAAAAPASEASGDLGERNDADRGGGVRDGHPRTLAGPIGPGELSLSLRPEDASVYVDGSFRGAGREAERLQLAPGRHRVEVARPGFRTLNREVDVQAGRTVELDASMEQQQP